MAERTRHFWLSMTYACDNPLCRAEVRFLLEDGCEGPKVEQRQIKLSSTSPSPLSGQLVPVFFTAAGRQVVPVPFVAGRCRRCEGGTRQGRFGTTLDAGYLQHVRWNEDAPADLTVEGEPDQPYFAYPSNNEFKRYGDQACGRPVFPGGASGG